MQTINIPPGTGKRISILDTLKTISPNNPEAISQIIGILQAIIENQQQTAEEQERMIRGLIEMLLRKGISVQEIAAKFASIDTAINTIYEYINDTRSAVRDTAKVVVEEQKNTKQMFTLVFSKLSFFSIKNILTYGIPILIILVLWHYPTLREIISKSTPGDFITNVWRNISIPSISPSHLPQPFSCEQKTPCANPNTRIDNKKFIAVVEAAAHKQQAHTSEYSFGNDTAEYINNLFQYLNLTDVGSYMSANDMYNISTALPTGTGLNGSLVFCDSGEYSVTPNITNLGILVESTRDRYKIAFVDKGTMHTKDFTSVCTGGAKMKIQVIPHVEYNQTTDEQTQNDPNWFESWLQKLHNYAVNQNGKILDLSSLMNPQIDAQQMGSRNWYAATVSDFRKNKKNLEVMVSMGLNMTDLQNTPLVIGNADFSKGFWAPTIEPINNVLTKTQYYFNPETAQLMLYISNTFNKLPLSERTNIKMDMIGIIIVSGIESAGFDEKSINEWNYKGLMQLGDSAITEVANYLRIPKKDLEVAIMNPVINLYAGILYSAIMIDKYGDSDLKNTIVELKSKGKTLPLWASYLIHQQGLSGFYNTLEKTLGSEINKESLLKVFLEYPITPPVIRGLQGRNSEEYLQASFGLLKHGSDQWNQTLSHYNFSEGLDSVMTEGVLPETFEGANYLFRTVMRINQNLEITSAMDGESHTTKGTMTHGAGRALDFRIKDANGKQFLADIKQWISMEQVQVSRYTRIGGDPIYNFTRGNFTYQLILEENAPAGPHVHLGVNKK